MEQTYFTPGQVVTLKQSIPNTPIMMVVRKEVSFLKKLPTLLGIRCRWFTSTGELQEAVFNTKDLVYYE